MRPRWTWKKTIFSTLAALILLPSLAVSGTRSRREVSVHAAGQAGAVIADTRIRIACYNIAHGRGTADSNWQGGSAEVRSERLQQIADHLRQIDADVVVLNEVDFDCSWSHRVNQAEFLARRAGYPYWAQQCNVDARLLWMRWRFGNAVLSKIPLARPRILDYPPDSAIETFLAGQKRGLICELQLGGQRAELIAVHLSSRSDAVRRGSARQLAELVKSSQLPVIVAGDFNADLIDGRADQQALPAITQLLSEERLAAAPTSVQARTFPSTQPDRLIDWILVPRRWKIANDFVPDWKTSDHLPVVVDVVIHPPSARVEAEERGFGEGKTVLRDGS